MKIETSETKRGFKLIKFEDSYGQKCSIQKSSLASHDTIWFGTDDANPLIMESKIKEGGTGWVKYVVPEDVLFHTQMHLDQKQAEQLIKILQKFVDTGEI